MYQNPQVVNIFNRLQKVYVTHIRQLLTDFVDTLGL